MSLIFTATGSLNIAADPADLPAENSGGTIVSGEMQRCKNLRNDLDGKLVVRDGVTKLNQTALDQTRIHAIIEQAGNRYTFAGSKIYFNEAAIETGLSDLPWSAVLYSPYNSETQSVYALNGSDRKRIEGQTVYEWGIEAPTVAPTLATGSLTGLTGEYNAKYSYCRKEGSTVVSESNLSPAGASAATLTDQSLSVSWTASSDSQVTHVRVYRTLTGGSVYYHDQDVAVGTTTVDTNTADASLGTEEHTDHNRPPAGAGVYGPTFDGTLFILDDNRLYFCKPKQPDYWPSSYYVEVSTRQFPALCMVFHNGQGYTLTKKQIAYIQGTGATTFFPLPMESVTGASGRLAAASVHGHGVFHVGADGLYLYSGQDRNVTESNFRPIFRFDSTNGVPACTNLENAWLIQFRNNLYFGFPGLNGDYGYTHDFEADDEYLGGTGLQITVADATNSTENIFTWEETYASAANEDAETRGAIFDTWPTNALVYNLDRKRWAYLSWPMEIRTVTVDATRDRLLAGGDDGFLYVLENPDADDDAGDAISWEFETKDYVLQTRRHFPRWVKYDIDASGADSVSGTMQLDGATHQTHTITGNRSIKRRLVATGNGSRCSIRVSGEGPATIYALEAE